MGCGCVRNTQEALYANEIHPKSYFIGGKPDGEEKKTYNMDGVCLSENVLYFNDKELFKQCIAVHVDAMAIQAGEYISGMSNTMGLDNDRRVIARQKAKSSKSKSINIAPKDHITELECTYNDDYVCSLKITTLTGNSLSIQGSKGEGPKSTTVSLKDKQEAVVGFKGIIDGTGMK